MQKVFDAFEKITIKNAAMAVYHYNNQISKIDKQIEELQKKQFDIQDKIEGYERLVSSITGGYTPQALCELTKKGMGMAGWSFKYPSTIIPVEETTEPNEETQEPAQQVNEAEPETQEPYNEEEEKEYEEAIENSMSEEDFPEELDAPEDEVYEEKNDPIDDIFE